jgi:hypothetical protein
MVPQRRLPRLLLHQRTVKLVGSDHPAREPAMADKRRDRKYIAEFAQAAGIATRSVSPGS